jgi:hypothetical protein
MRVLRSSSAGDGDGDHSILDDVGCTTSVFLDLTIIDWRFTNMSGIEISK